MAMQEINNGESGASVRAKINANFENLDTRLAAREEIDLAGKLSLLRPRILQQPTGGLVASGSQRTVTVVLAPDVGYSPTLVQVEQTTDGGTTWQEIEGAESASYTTQPLTSDMTGRFRCTNDFGVTYSSVFTVSVLGFAVSPQNVNLLDGESYTLTGLANLSGASYQYRERIDGVMTPIPGATDPNYALGAMDGLDDGRVFDLVIAKDGVQVISPPVTISVLAITQQPIDAISLEGDPVDFEIATNQADAVLQWSRQVSGVWTDFAGADEPELAVTGTRANNGLKIRNTITWRGRSLLSDVVTRHVFFIATQPTNVSVNEGQTATFTCVASVPGTAYQLQRSVNNGSTWSDFSGGSTGTYSIASVHGEDSGDRFRWKLSAGELELTSNVATLSANLLLDTYPGAVGVVSMRRRRTAYRGPVIKVRRSSDSAERDFNSREITDGTLVTWVGAGSGFVTTVYDQVGTNHATQTTAILQPRLVNAGSLEVTESGLPSIRYIDASATEQGPHLRINPWYAANTPFVGAMSIYRLLSDGATPDVIGSEPASYGFTSRHNAATRALQTRTLRTGGASAANGSTLTLSKTYLRYDYADRTNVRTYLNTATSTAVSTTDRNEDFQLLTAVMIGSNNAVASVCDTQISELLFFATDPSAYQAALRARLVTEHSIT